MTLVDGLISKYYVQFWDYDLFYQSRQNDFLLAKKTSNISIVNSIKVSQPESVGYNLVQVMQIV